MKIAVLHWPTSSVGGINTRLRTYRKVADQKGDTFHVLVSANQKTKHPLLLPERKLIRGGDSYITIDGYAPHHRENYRETLAFLTSYDVVMLSFLCPHPTKAYGGSPVFMALLKRLNKLDIPIVGYISDAYWDTYKEFGEQVLPLCEKTLVTQPAYGEPLVKAGYPVQTVYIPFIPIGKPSEKERIENRVVWMPQWKNVKGIKPFFDGVPRLLDKGYEVKLYNSGIEYYNMRKENGWKKVVGKDFFAPQYSGKGLATYYGWVSVERRAKILSRAGFMADFQGHRAKYKAYRRGSYNNTIVEALYYGCVPVVHKNLLRSAIPDNLVLPISDLAKYPEAIMKYDVRGYPRKEAREYVNDNHSAYKLYDEVFDEFRR